MTMDPVSVAGELVRVVDETAAKLRRLRDAEAAARPAPGKWSRKEIVGHLLDSSCNNLQRFVRAQAVSEFEFPGYEQDHWVRAQDHQARPWEELIELWRLANRHLAHVMTRIPKEKLAVPCRISTQPPMTLGELVEDYLVHFKHHLAQLKL